MFVNIDEEILYPKELIDRCSEMGITLHLALVKVTDSALSKQFVGRIGKYTVLVTSINFITAKQVFMRRMVDIVAGLVGCIVTGVIFIIYCTDYLHLFSETIFLIGTCGIR